MKAFLCKEFGPVDSHKVEEIEDPVAGPGQVVVDIKATGISFPDVLIVQGLYQFKPPFPFSPGSEISGVISSVGEGVTMHKEGDRVMGSIGSGGLCEKGAYSEHQLMPLPESMDFNTAAGFPLNYGTTYHAFKQRGELKAELKSAKNLSSDEITKITEVLTKNFNSKIKLNYKNDPSLIGGLIVQVGSTMVDTSIKSKLQQIENKMIEA